jgi:hypothetical protein
MSALQPTRFAAVLAGSLALTACNAVVDASSISPELDAAIENELVSSNGLTANAMSTNALTANAMSTNALTANAMSTNAMSTNAMKSILLSSATGPDAAQVIKYSVRCMLRPDQKVSVTYRKANGSLVTEVYAGTLGIQPNWTTTGLSTSDRRWLGSCLAAHVNKTGVSVSFSARGPHPALGASFMEMVYSYMNLEGAFWSKYDPTAQKPYTFYACSGLSSWAAIANRFCASGECGPMFKYVGSCDPERVCEDISTTNAAMLRCHSTFNSSGAPTDAATHEVVTTFVRSDLGLTSLF